MYLRKAVQYTVLYSICFFISCDKVKYGFMVYAKPVPFFSGNLFSLDI